jgi:type IV pilus assembly protein PilP
MWLLNRKNFSQLAFFLCLLLVACGSKPSTKPKSAQNADITAPTSVDDKPKVRDLFNMKSKALEYSYNPIGKRDPFKESTVSPSTVVQLDRGGPLTAYDIDQMKLVAVIWGISDPRGMVVLPDGKSYIIKRNSPMGKHYGKVARITPDSVIIEEEFRGALGDLQIKESKLQLTEKDKPSGFNDETTPTEQPEKK